MPLTKPYQLGYYDPNDYFIKVPDQINLFEAFFKAKNVKKFYVFKDDIDRRAEF